MKNVVKTRYVRMIQNATAASRDNPSLILEYEAGKVYQLDASTVRSFIVRGLAQPGRVVETLVSDDDGTSTAEFHFVPEGEDAPAVETRGPAEVVPFTPVTPATPQPLAPDTPATGDGAPGGNDPPPVETTEPEVTASVPRSKRRGKFTAQPEIKR